MKKKQNSFIKILFVSVVFFIGWLMMIIIKEPVIQINEKAYKSVQHNGNIRKQ